MEDKKIKQDLAYSYKILAGLGLADLTYTHLSSRSFDKKSYYIYPFGLLFEEVTPDLLMRVDFEGNVLEGAEYQYNKTGYIIHSAIYTKRPDINSIFHIHTPSIVAVSACVGGLLPISQWALHFYGKMSYHDYNSLALDKSYSEKLGEDLGENYNMLLRGHGSITSGRTIQEAMFYTYHLEQACITQCLAKGMNEKLIIPSEATCEKAVHDLLSFEADLGVRDWKALVRKYAL